MSNKVSDCISSSELSSILHDLKTPITSIMGFVELLQQNNYDEKSRIEFCDIILSESQKLLGLVNSILCIHKESAKDLASSCNLSIQINRYVAELAPLAGKRDIKILISNIANDIYVSIPEDSMSRILTNIIENAIKYNKEHGKIFIDLYDEDDQVFIKIRDTGIGIPEDELDKIFSKYYRSRITKNVKVEGSGIGLAIVNDIVKKYNGQIKVNSKIGEYTEFIVSFPKSCIKGN